MRLNTLGSDPARDKGKEFVVSFFDAQELSKESEGKLRKEIGAIIKNPDRFIDKGGAGSVYKLSSVAERGLCVKVLEHRENAPDPGHTADIEARYQRRMCEVEVAGVRSPRCFGYWMSEGEEWKAGIIMEQLDAVNLQHVLNGTESLPETFDSEEFFGDLEEYIDNMHEKLKILHGDMAARNIMVDRKTGRPYLIDYGRAESLLRVPGRSREMKTREEFDIFYEIQEQIEGLDKN